MTPPSAGLKPPVNSNLQELPFKDVTWENFEKLCLRLARLETDVEHCQRYGVKGDDQDGIDLYARQRTSPNYVVYQCKNEKQFGATKIENAVSEFLEGAWAKNGNTFVLCTRESLAPIARAKELEKQAMRLNGRGITLIPWDSDELSIKLKTLPEIVNDFFGREWMKGFCGPEAAAKLGTRLDADEVVNLRGELSAFYRHLFNNHDPGLPLYANADDPPPPLESRYVLSDIDERRVVTQDDRSFDILRVEDLDPKNVEADVPQSAKYRTGREHLPIQRRRQYRQRQNIEKWLTSHERNIVLGAAGSGKSSLLRFLCLDLMGQNPHMSLVAEKWGQHLPIWIPFAFWSKQVASSTSHEVSLKEALRDWLRSWDHEALWELVERALEDSRLLLVVDGLDEHRDEYAARTAWLRLKMFVEERGVSSIVTSRPVGLDRLAINTAGWQKGELSEFSSGQQEQLARIWFTHRAESNRKRKSDRHIASFQIEAEVNSFMHELRRSNDLRELAGVPLLLCLLIAHKVQHLQLPRNRFKAYDDLIEYLISTHPRQRALAAASVKPIFEIDDKDLKAVFANLAYEIHCKFGEGLIEQTLAEDIVANYLRDPQGTFGLEVAKARALSRDLVNVGEQSLALLVRGSQVDLSFLHRALQEYLAACHLATLPLSDQLIFVESVCADPKWTEAILSLLYLTRSTESVTALVQRIRAKQNTAVGSYAVAQILGEVAFGDFNLSVSVAKELAHESFTEIETKSWLPHRERLLENAIGGLRSVRTREMVQTKLKSWFPDRTRWTRESVFLAIREWPSTPDVRDALLRGLFDEYSDIQRAAGRTLADLFGGDTKTKEIVARLAWQEDNPRVRAAAIECLFKGWPDCEKLKSILEANRSSAFPRLRLAAIAGIVERNEQRDNDQAALFELGMGDVGIDYRWRDLLVNTLATGWRGLIEVKQKCFDAIEKSRNPFNYSRFLFDTEIAKAVLLIGFPKDEDVAKYFAREVVWDHVRLENVLPSETDFFELLKKQFPAHPLVIDAVDKWLVKQERKGKTFFKAALVGRTSTAKSLLLQSLDTKHLPFAVEALLRGWGMEDREVAEALTKLVRDTETEAAFCGEFIPDILQDSSESRSRLLSLLSSPHHRASQYVLAGLMRLRNTQGDTEVVDAALELPLNSDGKNPALGNLIKGYSSDPRVRELAKAELTDPHGFLGIVAAAYGNDEEFRRSILESVTPLPSRLRQSIAERLGDADDDFSLSLLESYNLEVDVEARVQAAISYCRRLMHSESDVGSALEIVRQRIVSVDPEWLKTRHAALASLIELHSLEVVKEVEDGFPDKRCRIPLERERVLPSVPLQRLILKNWDYLHSTFGEEFWSRFDIDDDRELRNFWYHFSAFADEYPQPRKALMEFLKTHTHEELHSPWVLLFLNRTIPRGELLKHLCMSALAGRDNKFDDSYEEALIAAELLVKNFTSDQGIWQWLKANIKDNYDEEEKVPENIVIALSEGWPMSPEFKRVSRVIEEKNQALTFPALIYLSCVKDIPSDVLVNLDHILFWIERSDVSRNTRIVKPLVNRLQQDDELLQLMITKLQNNPTSTEKATYIQLIDRARGIGAIKDWCVLETERQQNGNTPPEIGMDATQGEFIPITHILLSALNSS